MNNELKRKIRIIVIIYTFFGMAIGEALKDFNRSLGVTNPTNFDISDAMPLYVHLILSIGSIIAAIIQKIRVRGNYIPLFLLSIAIAIFPWYLIEPIIYNKFGFISILIIKNIEFLSVITFAYFLYKAFINEEKFIIDKHGEYTLWDYFTTDFFRKKKQSDTLSMINKKQ